MNRPLLIKRVIYFCFACVSTSLYAQSKFSVKLYQNTDLFKTRYTELPNKIEESQVLNFHRPSIAFEIKVRRNFVHEIELFIPEISKSLVNVQFPLSHEFKKSDVFDGRVSSYSMRYELGNNFFNFNRLTLCFGLGLNPYYLIIEYIPNIENVFYSSTKMYGVVLNAVPRLRYVFNSRFSINLSIPLKTYDFREQVVEVKNPVIPRELQTNKNSKSLYFEKAYTISLGFVYSFN